MRRVFFWTAPALLAGALLVTAGPGRPGQVAALLLSMLLAGGAFAVRKRNKRWTA